MSNSVDLLEEEAGVVLSSSFLLECTPVDLECSFPVISRTWLVSLRVATGSMKVGDSVPTLPTSLGTW